LTEELSVLIEVTRKLEAAGVPYMLTGSMAANVYAAPRMTRDLDLIVEIAPETLAKLPVLFPEHAYYMSPEAAKDAVDRHACFNLIHLATMVKIDLMVRKPTQYRMLEFSRRLQHEIEGHSVWVVSKEDLILSKLDWSRESESDRQLADVRNLLATGCDLAYLKTWAHHLQLTDILTRVSA
jgi:hypothetical protein